MSNLKYIEIGILVVIGIVMIITQQQISAIESKCVALQPIRPAAANIAPSAGPVDIAAGDKVKVEFYVMSQCPYGVQVEEAIKPVLDQIGPYVDFHLDFIANDLGNGNFRSLHGQAEVEGNIVQLCAFKHNPDLAMEMVSCMNQNSRGIPSNWEKCASDKGLDVESIRTCYEGGEGAGLLSSSVVRSQSVGAQGSPTMFINGKPYSGERSAYAFKQAICQYLPAGTC